MTQPRYHVVERLHAPSHYVYGVYDTEQQREVVMASTRERADNHCNRLNALQRGAMLGWVQHLRHPNEPTLDGDT